GSVECAGGKDVAADALAADGVELPAGDGHGGDVALAHLAQDDSAAAAEAAVLVDRPIGAEADEDGAARFLGDGGQVVVGVERAAGAAGEDLAAGEHDQIVDVIAVAEVELDHPAD